MSHGFSSYRTMHSIMSRDFASHGYIVFAINHKDMSCMHTKTKGGVDIYVDKSQKLHEPQIRPKQIVIRESEILALIQEMSDPKFLAQFNFGAEIKLDLENIVIAGHSFGGMTALSSAEMFPNVKASILLDPWFYTYEK